MASSPKRKVLLVEDDEALRRVMKIFFEAEGYHFLAVENGEMGLKELSNQEYDIIISDYMLPGMNGLEFLKAIQMSPKRPSKVLITDFGNPEILAQAREYGAFCCIEKPLTAEKLETCLVQLSDY